MTREEWIEREFPRHASGLHDGVRERFLSKIEIADDDRACWPWRAAAFKTQGRETYGAFGLDRRAVKAHRVALEMSTGVPIPAGLEVCHGCPVANPRCCRPSHLRADSHRSNMKEAAEANRMGRNAKRLTLAAVEDIIASVAAGERQAAIAARHGIASCTVSLIASGKRRPHVKRPVPGQQEAA